MLSVNIHQAKTELSKLIAKVENKGSVITICRYGRPVAELWPIRKNPSFNRQDNSWIKKVKILGDITKPVW